MEIQLGGVFHTPNKPWNVSLEGCQRVGKH